MKAKPKAKPKAQAGLVLDPRNAKRHSDKNRKQIRQSLESVGPFRSIGAVRGVVKVGNGVYTEAQALGLKVKRVKADRDTLIVVDRDDLTDAEADRAAMLDNLAADSSAFDYEAARFAELVSGDELLKQMAQEEKRYAELLQAAHPAQAEAVDAVALEKVAEQLQAKWRTETGQLWQIGKHRLIIGDCTDRAVIARLFGDEKPRATVTDPPYGVGVDYGVFDDTLENVRELIKRVMPIVLDYLPAALTPGIPAMWDYPRPAWVGAWVHPASTSSGAWGFVGSNPILYYGKDPYLAAGKGRRDSSIVSASDRKGEKVHPVSKPLNVWTWLVERMTTESGAIVFDPFCGSGTTLVAAERLGRVGRGVELSPSFSAISLERLSNLGLKCERVSDDGKGKRRGKGRKTGK